MRPALFFTPPLRAAPFRFPPLPLRKPRHQDEVLQDIACSPAGPRGHRTADRSSRRHRPPGSGRRRRLAEAPQAEDHRQRHAHDRASRRRTWGRARPALPRAGRAPGAPDPEPRGVRRQRDRRRALRGPRPHPHRGTDRSPIATTASTISTSPPSPTTASRSGSTRPSRSGDARTSCATCRPRHPHEPPVRPRCPASRATSATATATTRPPGLLTEARLQAPPAIPKMSIRSRSPRACVRGSPSRSTWAASARTKPWAVRVDPRRVQPVARRDLRATSPASVSELPALAEPAADSSSPAVGANYGYYTRAGTRTGLTAPAKESSVFDGLEHHPTPASSPGARQAARPRVLTAAARSAIDKAPLATATAAFTLTESRPPPLPSLARRAASSIARRHRPQRIRRSRRRLFVLKHQGDVRPRPPSPRALGLELSRPPPRPAGLPEPTGPGAAFAAPPTMPAPGARPDLRGPCDAFTNRGRRRRGERPKGSSWRPRPAGRPRPSGAAPASTESRRTPHDVLAASIHGVPLAPTTWPISTKPYFSRPSGLQQSRYDARRSRRRSAAPASEAPATRGGRPLRPSTVLAGGRCARSSKSPRGQAPLRL
jgi:hypothetical protein